MSKRAAFAHTNDDCVLNYHGSCPLQCSNYYRSLITSGKISDPNYFFDEEGKIRYKFKGKGGEGMCSLCTGGFFGFPFLKLDSAQRIAYSRLG